MKDTKGSMKKREQREKSYPRRGSMKDTKMSAKKREEEKELSTKGH